MSLRVKSYLAATVAALLMCGVAAGIDTRQLMPNFTATTMDGQKVKQFRANPTLDRDGTILSAFVNMLSNAFAIA